MDEPFWKSITIKTQSGQQRAAFMRQPSISEALGYVLTQQTRHGRLVTSQSVDKAARESKANKQILEELLEKIKLQRQSAEEGITSRQEKQKRTDSLKKKLLQLEHQREILTAMTQFGDRRIDARELAAALAIVHGLDEYDLRDAYNAAHQLRFSGNPPYQGSMTSGLNAIRSNSMKWLHHKLSLQNAFTPHMCLSELKNETKKTGNNEKASLKGATAILDLTGSIQKGPTCSTHKSYVWVHSKHEMPEPVWNFTYLVLKEIVNNWSEKRQASHKNSFGKREQLFGRTIQEKNKLALNNVELGLIFDNLESAGLIHSQRTKGHRKYTPTSEAIEWVKHTINTKVLHPELNTRLLGAHQEEKPPLKETRIKEILLEIRFRQGREKQPGLTRKEIAEKAKISIGKAKACEKMGSTTLKKFNPESLHQIADYLESQGHTEEAGWLHQHAAENEDTKQKN